MPTPVHAAERRLRGHLVDTPVLGDLRVPGFDIAPCVRVKVECLQTAGGAWFRGYLHCLLRSRGRFKGVVVHGDTAQVTAQVRAAGMHRLPMIGVGPLPEDLDVPRFGAAGSAELDAAAAARETGFFVLPGVEDRQVAAGLGTLGAELAAQLPADVARFVVTEEAFVLPVRRGLRAGDRDAEVVAVAPALERPREWDAAVHAGLRVVPDAAGCAALWGERDTAVPTCVVL